MWKHLCLSLPQSYLHSPAPVSTAYFPTPLSSAAYRPALHAGARCPQDSHVSTDIGQFVGPIQT